MISCIALNGFSLLILLPLQNSVVFSLRINQAPSMVEVDSPVDGDRGGLMTHSQDKRFFAKNKQCKSPGPLEIGNVYLCSNISPEKGFVYMLPNSTVHDVSQSHAIKTKPVKGIPGDKGFFRTGNKRIKYRVADVPWLVSHYSRDDNDVFDANLASAIQNALLSENSEPLGKVLKSLLGVEAHESRYRFMNTVVRAVGKSPRALIEFFKKTNSSIIYRYCDQAEINLFQDTKLGLNLKIHLFDQPREGCDSMVPHDHPGEYATYTMAEGQRQNVYVHSGDSDYPPSRYNECSLSKISSCDPGGDLWLPNEKKYIRSIYCGKSTKGQSHIFPLSWIHRVHFDGTPRRPGITVFFQTTDRPAVQILAGAKGPDVLPCTDCAGTNYAESLLSYMEDTTNSIEFDLNPYIAGLQTHNGNKCTWEK